MTERLDDAATLWELVERRAEATPDAVLLISEAGATLTCTEFRDQALRAAAGFAALGVGHGTRVTWELPNRFATVIASFALARLGAVQNPVLHFYRHKEMGYAIRATDAELVLVPGTWNGFDFTAMVTELVADQAAKPQIVDVFAGLPDGDPADLAPAPTDGDEVRWVYFTSGTTSDPKGVRHTDRTLITGANGLAVALDMSPDDVGSIAFPYSHIAGPDYFGTMLLAGFGAVLFEAFAPATAIPVLAEHGVTMVGGGTAFYQMYLTEQRKDPGTPILPALRKMSGGGAPMPPEIYEEVKREFGVKICHGYGMTECPMICEGSPHDTDEQLANTVGKPVEGLEMRIATDVEQADDEGEGPRDGEIRLKGPMVFAGYTDPEASEAAFDGDGWFRTGDLGHIRPDGHVVLTGRLKDVIIRKGENISAQEIEHLLYAHPKVGDVAVVGLPDAERGERVCAVVERAEGQDDLMFEEMTALLTDAQLMRQKFPEQLEIVDALPRNETLRKVLKFKLRETYAAQPWKA